MNDKNKYTEAHKTPSADGGLEVDVNMFYGVPQILFAFAKLLRYRPTEAEDFLWKQLSKKNIQGVRFKRQHPILYFIADFYCHVAKLVIEVDGGYHRIPAQYEYDFNRDTELEDLGLKVLRFTNEQVLFDIDNTIPKIEREVIKRKPHTPPALPKNRDRL